MGTLRLVHYSNGTKFEHIHFTLHSFPAYSLTIIKYFPSLTWDDAASATNSTLLTPRQEYQTPRSPCFVQEFASELGRLIPKSGCVLLAVCLNKTALIQLCECVCCSPGSQHHVRRETWGARFMPDEGTPRFNQIFALQIFRPTLCFAESWCLWSVRWRLNAGFCGGSLFLKLFMKGVMDETESRNEIY